MTRCPVCYARVRESEFIHEMTCSARRRPVRKGTSESPVRATRNRQPPEHGTVSRYASSKWKCRCAACTQANTAYKRTRYDADRETRRAYNREWMRRQREAAS